MRAADDLRDALRLSYRGDRLVDLLDAVDDLEHGRDELLLRAMRCLEPSGEPVNRHPLTIARAQRAASLRRELLAMYDAGELLWGVLNRG